MFFTTDLVLANDNLVDPRTDGLELSLKLYHVCDLGLGHQQSIAEAP